MSNQMGSADLTSEDKLWSALCYIIWPLAIIALLMEDKKARPFIKFNAVQSLVLGIVISIIAGITVCFGSVLFLFMLYPAWKSYQGEWVTLPFITDFIKNQGWA